MTPLATAAACGRPQAHAPWGMWPRRPRSGVAQWRRGQPTPASPCGAMTRQAVASPRAGSRHPAAVERLPSKPAIAAEREGPPIVAACQLRRHHKQQQPRRHKSWPRPSHRLSLSLRRASNQRGLSSGGATGERASPAEWAGPTRGAERGAAGARLRCADPRASERCYVTHPGARRGRRAELERMMPRPSRQTGVRAIRQSCGSGPPVASRQPRSERGSSSGSPRSVRRREPQRAHHCWEDGGRRTHVPLRPPSCPHPPPQRPSPLPRTPGAGCVQTE